MLEPGLELVRASNLTQAFRPHRHDCYVVGITQRGVQSFAYRGSQHHAMPGDVFAIHPDEQHDGRPGTEEGYGYCAAYIDPALVSDALGRQSIPFVKEAVGSNPMLIHVMMNLFAHSDIDDDNIARSSCLTDIADVLAAMSDDLKKHRRSVDRKLANRVRTMLADGAVSGVTMTELEAELGFDRFTITRQFRRCFGISPQRYMVQRRVSRARELIERGADLSGAAMAAGFADQSHMTRHFVRTLGVTPGHWRHLST